MKIRHTEIIRWLTALAIAGVLGLVSASAATITWTNLAGGSWSNPGNWDLGTVPGAADTANITLAGTYTVTLDANVTVSNLTAGAASGTQTLNWYATDLVVSNFTIASNASFNPPLNSELNLSGTINNQGTINWGTTNALYALSNYAVNNSGLFNLQTNFNTANFSWYQQNDNFPGSFNSTGTFLVQSNAGTITFFPGLMRFTNSGTFTVGTNSTLALEGAANTGVWMVFNDGTLITGAGLVQDVNCDIIANGNITVNGTFELDGTVEGFIAGAAGQIQGTQTWSGTGTFNWNGGAIGNYLDSDYPYDVLPTNITTFTTNFQVNISSDSSVNSQIVNNQGTINWNMRGGYFWALGNESIFNNNGLIILQGGNFLDITDEYLGPLSIFNNNGTILVTNTANSTYLVNEQGWMFTNTGVIEVQTNATLDLESYITNGMTFADGAVMNVAGTGQLTSGDAQDASYLTANGTITVNGPSNSYGNIAFNQNAYLQGTQTWTGTGSVGLAGVTLYQAGTTTFASNFQVYVPGEGTVTLNAHTLVNQGTLTAPSLVVLDSGQPGAFINNGLFVVGGMECYETLSTNIVSSFNNTGTIVVSSSLYSTWNMTNSGTIEVETNATLEMNVTNLTLSDGTVFSGAGQIWLDYPWSPGDVTGTVTANGNITVNCHLVLGSLTVLQGTQTWIGTGSLGFDGPTLYQPGTTTIGSNFQANATYPGPDESLILDGHTLLNQGTLTASEMYIYDSGQPGAFINSGLLLVGEMYCGETLTPGSSFNNTGTIVISNWFSSTWNMTNSSTIEVANNATAEMNVTNLTLNDGTVFSGAGQIMLDNPWTPGTFPGTVTANGNITVNCPLALGSLTVLLQGTQAWNGAGSLTWGGGSIVQPGTTTIATNFTLYITDIPVYGSSDRSLTQNHVLNNQGIVMWNTPAPIGMSNQAAIINSGLVVLQTSCALQETTADCGFKNQSGGIVRVVGGNSWVNCPFTNCGTLDLELGTLTVSNTYALRASSVNRFAAGGPATVLTVPALNPAGTLSVILTNGYVPVNGSQFTLVNYGSHYGKFANLQAPTLPAGLEWQLNYGATSLVLEAITTPTQINSPMMLPNGAFQFTFSGPPGNSYLIQASSNFVDWVTLQTNGVFPGTAVFTDTTATNFGNRFYRGVIGY